ncbi:MAG: EAL domain-containing protein [Pseudogulbenkiania sp.]|nr:EAL domain-containing protein [Pseudogulbenkiania sp.]
MTHRATLSRRYALYIGGTCFAALLLLLVAIAAIVFSDGASLRDRLKQQLHADHIQEQQAERRQLAAYIGKEFFNPLYQLDIYYINKRIRRMKAELPIEQFLIADASGKVLTDGSAANPAYGMRLNTGDADGTPQLSRFSIVSPDGQTIGYGAIHWSDHPLHQALARQDGQIAAAWHALIQRFLLLGGLGLPVLALIALAVGNRLSRRLSAPLLTLRDAARRVAEGDLDVQVDTDTADELAELTRDFNHMVHRLRKTTVSRDTLRKSEARFRSLVEVSFDGIVLIDESGLVLYASPAAESMIGYPNGELSGLPIATLLAESEQASFAAALGQVLQGQPLRGISLEARNKQGHPLPLEVNAVPVSGDAGVPCIQLVLRDVSERLRQQRQLEYQANYDSLTGLSNRSHLATRLTGTLELARDNGMLAAILLLDLDRFKTINDSLGHGIGDGVLQEVARRLKGCMRDMDTVARLGGDEFVLVAANLDDSDAAGSVAERVIRVFTQPFNVGGHDLLITPSIGISLYPQDGGDGETLLSNADAAMYRVKGQGRHGVAFYTPEMSLHAMERLELETALQQALRNEEFTLHYQPRFALDDRRILSAEALIRWQRPGSGLVSPAQFIPLAEETGLIVPIGAWALRTACTHCRAWQEAGWPGVSVAVNVSARQFHNDDIVALCRQVLAETGLQPHLLELEITETLAMVNPAATIATLQELKALGLRISLDDFGTGYSSLNQLKRFPIDHLKIDRSFVKDITIDPDDATITVTIIAMAHAMGLAVIAEGVETEAQADFLRQHRCDAFQGYYFSRPLPLDVLLQRLPARCLEEPAS